MKKINPKIIIIILLVIVLLITIKPALLGYTVNKQFKDIGLSAADIMKEIQSLKSDLLIADTSLESCQKLNQEYLDDLNDAKTAETTCTEEKTKLESDYDQLNQAYTQEKEQSESDYDSIKERYNNVLQNSADNICCKNKVDDPDIDSYILMNDKIICTSGEGIKINC